MRKLLFRLRYAKKYRNLREFLEVLPCILYIVIGVPPYAMIGLANVYDLHLSEITPFISGFVFIFGGMLLQRKVYIWYYRYLFDFIFNR